MRDLTQGSVLRHLLGMAAFIGFGLLVQTLYVLIDLYFVAHLGEHAVAGVAAAGSAMFAVMAATQLIGVGALSLISQAVGRKDQAEGQSVFEQSVLMAALAGLLTLFLILLAALFNRMQAYLRLPAAGLTPRWRIWRRIASLGLPAFGEFLLMFVMLGVVYWSIRSFGAEAQAGFGIGSRLTQAMFLPVMAIAFAASPIAGQNYGAGQMHRVRATFGYTAAIGSFIMLGLTLVCQIGPMVLVRPFTGEQPVAAAASSYLGIVSWNFVSVGLVLACSGMFQALGNTFPSLLSSASRLFTFVVPAVWLSYQPDASLNDFWHLSVLSAILQAALSLLLLRTELRRKLGSNAVAS
jgi:Na+-driven multidrug efflux pump